MHFLKQVNEPCLYTSQVYLGQATSSIIGSQSKQDCRVPRRRTSQVQQWKPPPRELALRMLTLMVLIPTSKERDVTSQIDSHEDFPIDSKPKDGQESCGLNPSVDSNPGQSFNFILSIIFHLVYSTANMKPSQRSQQNL